jgi:WD40 repeat protein
MTSSGDGHPLQLAPLAARAVVCQWLEMHGCERALAALEVDLGLQDGVHGRDGAGIGGGGGGDGDGDGVDLAALANPLQGLGGGSGALANNEFYIQPEREVPYVVQTGGMLEELVGRFCSVREDRRGRGERVTVCLVGDEVDDEADGEAEVPDAAKSARRAVLERLLEEPDEGIRLPAVKESKSYSAEIGHSGNVLSVAFGGSPDLSALLGLPNVADSEPGDGVAAFEDSHVRLVATGSSDKTVRVTDAATGTRICAFPTAHAAAILSVDFNPRFSHLLLTSAMDGSVRICDIRNGGSILQSFQDHRKYVVCARWSPDGTHFATASHDHSVNLYRCDRDSDSDNADGVLVAPTSFTKLKTFLFNTNAESLAFSHDGELIIAVREDNYLHIADVATQTISKFNMNEKGDDHVSFSALFISLSPLETTNEEFILVSTDADKLFLYHRGDSAPVRTFYGSHNDAYCQPRNGWHVSGKYIYSTSQDHQQYCWDVRTQLLVAKMPGHASPVRDMRAHPDLPLLVTGSFDKTVRLWGPPMLEDIIGGDEKGNDSSGETQGEKPAEA